MIWGLEVKQYKECVMKIIGKNYGVESGIVHGWEDRTKYLYRSVLVQWSGILVRILIGPVRSPKLILIQKLNDPVCFGP